MKVSKNNNKIVVYQGLTTKHITTYNAFILQLYKFYILVELGFQIKIFLKNNEYHFFHFIIKKYTNHIIKLV